MPTVWGFDDEGGWSIVYADYMLDIVRYRGNGDRPSFVPQGVNVYMPTGETFAWLRLEYDGEDLALEEDYDDELGTMDADTERELEDHGWEGLVSLPWQNDASGEGWMFRATGLKFALENGIAPGQRFLVLVEKPTYSETNNENGHEYDTQIEWQLLHVEPWNLDRVLRHWTELHAALYTDRGNAVAAMRGLKELRRTDTAAMYLSWFHYGDLSRYGVAVRLCSKHTRLDCDMTKCAGHDMLEGRDDKGDRGVAMRCLLERVAQRMPHLTADLVQSLPARW